MDKLLNEVMDFLTSPQLRTILALIGADLIAGVGAAVKSKVFEWRRLADFYGSNVVPLTLGYLAVWLVAKFAVVDLLGDYGAIASDGFIWAAWLAIVASLVGSIVANLKTIGTVKE
jgi:hypothetical protein